tara:strand:- start:1587 stop:2027 length:441 start_codon:yes stop_codon:yes gene_type:complete
MCSYSIIAETLNALTTFEISPRTACINDVEIEAHFIKKSAESLDCEISTIYIDPNLDCAIHSQQKKVVLRVTCKSQFGYAIGRQKKEYQTIEPPISINLPEERKTPQNLKTRLHKELARLIPANSRTAKAVKQCHPSPDKYMIRSL